MISKWIGVVGCLWIAASGCSSSEDAGAAGGSSGGAAGAAGQAMDAASEQGPAGSSGAAGSGTEADGSAGSDAAANLEAGDEQLAEDSGSFPEFGTACVDDSTCGIGKCIAFGTGDKLCTLPCQDASECPVGSQGQKCNQQGYCRP